MKLPARWRFGRVRSVPKQTISIGSSACPIGCSWFCTCWPPCGSPGSRREKASPCEKGREAPSVALSAAPSFASPCVAAAKGLDCRPFGIRSDGIILPSQYSRHSPGSVKAAIHENTHLGSGRVRGAGPHPANHHLGFWSYLWCFRVEGRTDSGTDVPEAGTGPSCGWYRLRCPNMQRISSTRSFEPNLVNRRLM